VIYDYLSKTFMGLDLRINGQDIYGILLDR
jgi:hypothetical protein